MPPPDIPPLTEHGPGRYRVRVHATGRDRKFDLAVSEAVERYLIQVWPVAQPDGDTILKHTDAYGAMMRDRNWMSGVG